MGWFLVFIVAWVAGAVLLAEASKKAVSKSYNDQLERIGESTIGFLLCAVGIPGFAIRLSCLLFDNWAAAIAVLWVLLSFSSVGTYLVLRRIGSKRRSVKG